jgi:predicted RNA-binding Zn-ribbon protein involved in translation (DUF1610 family)
MSQQNQPKVRRIVLPSGREIEVLRWGKPETDGRDLHVCPDCGSELVQPSDWSQRADGSFGLTLECPNCAWRESGIYEQAQVDRLEDQLDEGLIALIDDLHRLTQANMASDIDQFVGALNRDLILPEDF